MNSTILKKQLKLAIGHACKNLRTFPSCIESRPQNNSRAAMMNFWKKKKKKEDSSFTGYTLCVRIDMPSALFRGGKAVVLGIC